jgi:hypothetical protein
MVSPPQPIEKLKKWHPPSQVDLNGIALSLYVVVISI